jgi:hypothetical protein
MWNNPRLTKFWLTKQSEYPGGLLSATKIDDVAAKPITGEEIPWQSIQDQSGNWHWAEKTMQGTDLIVSNKYVTHPVAVRYAYNNRPLGVYLYNSAGLPASPFTTEEVVPRQQLENGYVALSSPIVILNRNRHNAFGSCGMPS